MVLWKMPCTRAGNFRYLGLRFRLDLPYRSPSLTRIRDNVGHVQGQVTLTCKVMLNSYSVDLYLFDISTSLKTCRTKKIITRVLLEQEIRKVTLWQDHVTLTFQVMLDSYSILRQKVIVFDMLREIFQRLKQLEIFRFFLLRISYFHHNGHI